jgi:hypothetical protein
MRFYEFNINESQGGIFRRAQEVGQGAEVKFKNAETNKEISLLSADVLPPSGTYETEEEIDQNLQKYFKEKGVDLSNVQFTGNPQTAKAALVSVWKDLETDKLVSFVKLVKKPGTGAAPIKQTNAEFKKAFGYGAQGKTAQRATLKLKPKDILTPDTWLNYNQISNSLKSKLTTRTDLEEEFKNGLISMIENISTGSSKPVLGMGEFESSLEIDFGETAAPVALITGNFIDGDYQSAEQNLLKPLGLTWKSLSQVLYPSAGGEKIYDSYIKLDKNNNLKISSKDKKGGAAASITGLVDAVNKSPEKFENVFENKKFVPIFDILKIIANPPNKYWKRVNKGVNGPLILAVENFKFISDDEARMIADLMTKTVRIPPEQAVKKGIITQNLFQLSSVKGAKFQDPAYNLGFHMMACVAKKIANTVNQNKNVSDLFRAILERSNMIQVKTTVTKSGNDATFSKFTVIYPPQFDGKLEMVADNNYMATRMPIAPLSFAIP